MKRIPSLHQIQASRKNGARSCGPQSPEAKERTRFNALQHGLTAKTAILPHESEPRFRALLEQLALEHQPSTLTELLLLENCATATWRLRRNLGYETAIHAHEIAHTAPPPGADLHTHAALTWADSRRLRLAARYQASQQRAFRQSLHDLLAFRHLGGDPGAPPADEETLSPPSDPANAATLRNDPEPGSASPHPQEVQ